MNQQEWASDALLYCDKTVLASTVGVVFGRPQRL